MITHDLIIKMLDFVKDPSCGTFEYGKWGTLNMEQRQLIRRLCESWLILDEATNKQMLEIERLNNIINELKLLAIDEKENKYWGNDSYINGKNEGVEELANAILEILDKENK